MDIDPYLICFFKNLQPITTATGVIAFVITCIKNWHLPDFPIDSLGRAATWCAAPSGVAFLICSAYPTYASKLSDFSIAFLIGGLALILIAIYDLKKLFKRTP